MAGEILVVAEHKDGAVKHPSLEALTAGARLAGERGTSAVALVAGPGAADAADELGRHGAAVVVTLDVDPADPSAWAAAVAGVAEERRPAVLLLGHTARGKDLGPRVAGLLAVPMASDCIDVSADGDAIVARRPVFAGKALINVATGERAMVVSLRPNAVTVVEQPAAGEVVSGEVKAPDKGVGAVLAEIVAAAQKKVELTEARVVVSGGRGLKGPENWHLVEGLAAELGAAVGASRAVVDAGWRPHAEQVGQTGKVVAPQLYIAIAISGAIQHLAGMRTSNYIVAINKDAEAPIFKVADYGIVGDAFEVVPRLTEAVKALKAQRV